MPVAGALVYPENASAVHCSVTRASKRLALKRQGLDGAKRRRLEAAGRTPSPKSQSCATSGCVPRAGRPLSGRIRRLSSRPGAAAVAPSKCAGPLSSFRRKVVHSSPTTTGSTIAAPQGRKRVRSPTGARVTAADTSISPGGNSGVPDCGTCEKGASEAKVSEVVVSNVDPLCARVIPQRTRACASAKHPSTRCVALDGDSSRESRRSEHDSSCVSTETCPSEPALQSDDCVEEISSDVPSCRADGEALSREPLTLPLSRHVESQASISKGRKVRKARAQVPSPKRVSFCDRVEVREYSRQLGACAVPSDGSWVTLGLGTLARQTTESLAQERAGPGKLDVSTVWLSSVQRAKLLKGAMGQECYKQSWRAHRRDMQALMLWRKRHAGDLDNWQPMATSITEAQRRALDISKEVKEASTIPESATSTTVLVRSNLEGPPVLEAVSTSPSPSLRKVRAKTAARNSVC